MYTVSRLHDLIADFIEAVSPLDRRFGAPVLQIIDDHFFSIPRPTEAL